MSSKKGKKRVKEKQTGKPTLAGVLLLVTFLIWSGEGALAFIVLPAIIESPSGVTIPVFTGMVGGRVIDEETGKGVEGARVSIGKYSTQTDPEGNFVLKDIPTGMIKIGIKDMVVSKNNYLTITLGVGVLPAPYAKQPQFKANETIRLRRGEGEAPRIKGKSIETVEMFIEMIKFYGGMSIVGAVFALVGAVGAFERKYYNLLIISLVLGLLCGIPMGASISFPFGSLLSFISLILILLSKDEFF
jgi:hypothetical protein